MVNIQRRFFFRQPASLLAFTLGIGGVDVMMLIHLNVWIWLAPAVFSFVFWAVYIFFRGAVVVTCSPSSKSSPVQIRPEPWLFRMGTNQISDKQRNFVSFCFCSCCCYSGQVVLSVAKSVYLTLPMEGTEKQCVWLEV